MKPQAFHPFARVLHWLMAVLILAMLFIGVSMVADLSLRHPVLISLHKATGWPCWCWWYCALLCA